MTSAEKEFVSEVEKEIIYSWNFFFQLMYAEELC